MTLYKYFKRKDCFPDPLSLAIAPRVIASVNEEVGVQALVNERPT